MTTTPLQRLRAAVEGATPLVPVAGSLGIVITSVEHGELVARMPAPPPALRGPGPTLVLVDMVLSAAISSALPADSAISTLTLHWAGARQMPAAGTPMTATGTVTHVDEEGGLSTGRLVDADGALVATLSCRCALLPRAGRRPATDGRPPSHGPNGVVALAGLDLTGGPATWRVTAAPGLSNSVSGVQGGVLAAVAAHAIAETLGADRPHLAEAPADLDVTFLRAVPADGAEFSVTTEPVHAGSRLGAGRAEVRDAAGRPAVVASAAHWRGRGA